MDDSADPVRIAVAHTLVAFMGCGGGARCYSSTMVGYTLDQLFIHLDDGNPVIQDCISKVILAVAEIDKAAVVKKAENARLSHRTPVQSNRIIDVLTLGYEVL